MNAGLPVRAGEEPWTAAELEQVRAGLDAEAGELRAEIARATLPVTGKQRQERR